METEGFVEYPQSCKQRDLCSKVGKDSSQILVLGATNTPWDCQCPVGFSPEMALNLSSHLPIPPIIVIPCTTIIILDTVRHLKNVATQNRMIQRYKRVRCTSGRHNLQMNHLTHTWLNLWVALGGTEYSTWTCTQNEYLLHIFAYFCIHCGQCRTWTQQFVGGLRSASIFPCQQGTWDVFAVGCSIEMATMAVSISSLSWMWHKSVQALEYVDELYVYWHALDFI